MNTNDLKAPYGHQPLLSEKEWPSMIENKASEHGLRPSELSAHDGMEIACDHYESLIQKGVLRVVKKVVLVNIVDDRGIGCLRCPDCQERFPMHLGPIKPSRNFCPGCGGEIQKP